MQDAACERLSIATVEQEAASVNNPPLLVADDAEVKHGDDGTVAVGQRLDLYW